MILGMGNDLCNIERIQASLDRFGARFEARIFTPREQSKARRRADTAAVYAKRFAAKEACAKALGTGFRNGIYWRDLEVVNLPSGQPTLHLTGGAALQLKSITPSGYQSFLHLTLTDDHPWAQAIVIISAQPIV